LRIEKPGRVDRLSRMTTEKVPVSDIVLESSGMTRVLELIVSLIIVAALVVVVGVLLPSHGRVERSVEVSNPVRQIYDSVNTLRRFPEWSAERRLDPKLGIEFFGPRSGVDAGVKWTGNEAAGNGSAKIISTELDSEVKMAVENHFSGENKTYTFRIEPSQTGKTARIFLTYEVDYGWNLLWRYAGLYIHGKPDAIVQGALGNLSSILASVPNADYKDQDIQAIEVTGVPMLFVSTKAPRTLDDVAEATDAAVARVQAVMKKLGLNQAGPVRTYTTNWGDENYVFDVAIPVDSNTFQLNDTSYTIEKAPEGSDNEDDMDDEGEAKSFNLGDRDNHGYLVLEDGVRATVSYSGLALVTEYTGSPASLPLLRLFEKAYSDSNGYQYSEMGDGRFWDEVAEITEDGESTFKVYLPVEP
jgi:hypothetical protein